MKRVAKRVTPAAAALLALLLCITSAHAADPGTSWPTCTPASKGLNATVLNQLRTATGWTSTNTTFLRGFLVKNGCKVFSWGSETLRKNWASAVKPVMSTMLFYAIKELKTTGVNARLYQYGWPMTTADQSITWHHVANMTSGYALPENPGARWAYNDYGISLYCQTLFPKVFEQTMAQVVANRLAPLQFQDGGVIGGTGCSLFASTRDAARIGQFWINRGSWRGAQLLPASYFDNYRKNQVSATLPRSAGTTPDDYLSVGSTGGGPNQDFLLQGGYGYNWWFNTPRRLFPAGPADTFLAVGHYGVEVIMVIPSLKIVFTGKFKNGGSFPAALANLNEYLRLLVEAHVSS
jgi:CubicO group peptidase (beta-lactamase class C family)